MPGIMHGFYHLKSIGFCFCICASRSQMLGTAVVKNRKRKLAIFKKKQVLAVLFNILTALEGILSGDGYVIFIGVVNMMARKCMIYGRTMTPDFLALPL